MLLNVKVKKTKHYHQKIKALRKKLTKLNDQKVFIGYFNDQGEHKDSGLRYVDLMAIHEFGAPDENIPSRPVMNLTQEGGLFTEQDRTAIREAFKGVFIKNIPVSNALDKIGMYYKNKGKNIFGSSLLQDTVEGNPPLIDTSELKDNFSYRTSFTYKLQ